MMSSEKPEDFNARWQSLVDFFNTVRAVAQREQAPNTWSREASDVFFELVNTPGIQHKTLTLAHALQALHKTGASSRDAGFIMFAFTVFGAVWGNGGVMPMIQMPPSDKDVPPEEMQ